MTWVRALDCESHGCLEATRCESSACAEVTTVDGHVHLRSSLRPDEVVVLDRDEWVVFVAGVKAGDFDAVLPCRAELAEAEVGTPAAQVETEGPYRVGINTRAERLAQLFHETYERLAPQHSYETRKASAKPWAEAPENNKALMVATCGEVLAHIGATAPADKRVLDAAEAWRAEVKRRGTVHSVQGLAAELIAAVDARRALTGEETEGAA